MTRCSVCGGDIDRVHSKNNFPRGFMREDVPARLDILMRVCLSCFCSAFETFPGEDGNFVISEYATSILKKKNHIVPDGPNCLARQCYMDYLLCWYAGEPMGSRDLSDLTKYRSFEVLFTDATITRRLRTNYGLKGLPCYVASRWGYDDDEHHAKYEDQEYKKSCFEDHLRNMGNFRELFVDHRHSQQGMRVWEHAFILREVRALNVPLDQRLALYKLSVRRSSRVQF